MDALSNVIEAFGWALLHFIWQGSLVGLAYALGRRVLQRASDRLVLGHLALISMAVLPALTLWGILRTPLGMPSAADVAVATLPIVSAVTDASDTQALYAQTLLWLVAIWATGVLVLGLRATGRWIALRRLCRQADPASQALQAVADTIAKRMGVMQPVAIRVVKNLATPIVAGCWKPIILLPMALAASLPLRQLELLIAHELAHVRRWDYFANLLQSALEIMLFYHPAVHWVSARVRQDREHCCDDLVGVHFDSRLTYARALLSVAEAQHLPVPKLALAASGGVLLPRIERILGLAPEPNPKRRDRVGMVALAASVALGTLTLLTRHDEPLQPLPTGMPEALALVGPVSIALSPPVQMSLHQPGFAPALAYFSEPAPAAGLDREAEEAQALAVALAPAPDAWLERPALVAPAATFPPALQMPVLAEQQLVEAQVGIDPGPALIHYFAPQYPKSALDRGVEGEVVLAFRISADGRPVDVEVVSAVPQRESGFVMAAKTALQGWRFEAPAGDEMQARRTFEFRLEDGEGSHHCRVRTGSRLCRQPE